MRVPDYLWRRRAGLMAAALALLADMALKAAVLHAHARGDLPWWLVPGEAGLSLHWNRGMSFSLLTDMAAGPWLLGGGALLASAWFGHWLGEREGWTLHQLGLGLVIGGALGNLVDRVQHGAVVDFIVLNPWGLFPYTFNPADVFISGGVIALLLDSWLRRA